MTVKRTGLCYWIARTAKPGMQSSNFSWVRSTVISHIPVRSRFNHIHILYKRNWDGPWLINLTQNVTRRYKFFKFAISVPLCCWVLVKHAILKGRDMVTVWRTVPLLSFYYCHRIMTSRGLKTYYGVAQWMNGLWMFITKHESPKGDS